MSNRSRKKPVPPTDPPTAPDDRILNIPEPSAPDAELLGDLFKEPYDAGLSTPTESPPTEPAKPAPKILGRLSDGPHDSGLHVGTPPAPPSAEPLSLPRGAWMAMRRSGGFKFRSREVVVYRSGRVAYDNTAGARVTTRLSDAQTEELSRALAAVDFSQPRSAGHQNPDAFAYEIIARMGRRAYTLEAFQGSIPAALGLLIGLLSKLATDDE